MNIAQRYVPAETTEREKLALYYYDGCPFCSIVQSFVDALDVDVELRNTLEVPQHRQDLVLARGRATVPVLRIVSPDDDEQWIETLASLIDARILTTSKLNSNIDLVLNQIALLLSFARMKDMNEEAKEAFRDDVRRQMNRR